MKKGLEAITGFPETVALCADAVSCKEKLLIAEFIPQKFKVRSSSMQQVACER